MVFLFSNLNLVYLTCSNNVNNY